MIYRLNDTIRFGTNIQTLKKLDVGNYLVIEDAITKEFYLKQTDEFKIPTKIYGKEQEQVDRYLNTFEQSSKMGILLVGLKGAGKTLTAKLICKQANLPVLIISKPYVGDSFQEFLNQINQPVIILIDEFEKVYSEDEAQQQLLPILDGVVPNKFLFLMTSNSFDINPYLKNRPSRIRYVRMYEGLSEEAITEIIDDLLEDETQKDELLELINMLCTISADVLITVINEMNMYNKSATEVLKDLNVQIEHTMFDVICYIEGIHAQSRVHYNPLLATYIDVSYTYKDSNTGYTRSRYYSQRQSNMDLSVSEGKFTFTDKQGNRLVFTPVKKAGMNLLYGERIGD